jgi:DNA-binding MurR/RpiR family transcriptional regulator
VTVLGDIKDALPQLTRVHQTVARYVLANPDKFLHQTVADIAASAGTSSASVIRFVRAMDYKDLQSFKLALAQQNAPQHAPLTSLVQASDDTETIAAKLSQAYVDTTKELESDLDVAAMQQATSLLKHARRVYIEGVGASGLAAQDLYLKLVRADWDVHYDLDLHTAVEHAYYSKRQDVMIAYSYSGQTEEVLLAVRQALANDTPVIAITRRIANPLGKLATVVLGLPPTEQLLRIGAVTSVYSQTFLGNLLFLGTVQDRIPNMESNYRDTSTLLGHFKEGEGDAK